MAKNDQDKKDHGRFPPDLAAALCFPLCTLTFLFVTGGVSWAMKFGDTSLFDAAVFLAAVGVVLLLKAKMPLYREHRFFTVGPGALKGRHRMLYVAAYCLIVPAVLLLVLLLAKLR